MGANKEGGEGDENKKEGGGGGGMFNTKRGHRVEERGLQKVSGGVGKKS